MCDRNWCLKSTGSFGIPKVQCTYPSELDCDQLDAFVRYVRLDARMVKALQTADWSTFARLYNGPSYAANQYDTKLAAAYKQALHDEAVA